MNDIIVKISGDELLMVREISENDIAYFLSLDGKNWEMVDSNSSVVLNNKNKIESEKNKLEFFNSHIGHKIKVNGNPPGWLVIKSLDNITLIPDNKTIWYSIRYIDIDFIRIDKDNFSLEYKLPKKEEIPVNQIMRENYEKAHKDSILNKKPIQPLNHNI